MCLYLSCALTFSMVDKDKCVLYNFIPPLQLSSLHPVCSPPPLSSCVNLPPFLHPLNSLIHSPTPFLSNPPPPPPPPNFPQPQVVKTVGGFLPCITLYYKLLKKIVIRKWVLIS